MNRSFIFDQLDCGTRTLVCFANGLPVVCWVVINEPAATVSLFSCAKSRDITENTIVRIAAYRLIIKISLRSRNDINILQKS